jgi:ribosome-binding factor A
VVSKLRAQRIADRLKEEMAELLVYKISDPRLEGVSVTDVTIDRELAFAEVYVSAVEGAQRSNEIMEGLEHAQGFIRRELAQSMDLRTFPRLRFHWDPTNEKADHIERLLASLKQEENDGAE